MNDKHRATTLLSEVSGIVERRAGLRFDRLEDLLRRIGSGIGGLGFSDVEEFLCAFTSEQGGARQLDLIAELFVTGETYFFRDFGLFAALRERILPELIRARAAARRLKIWSAGCATGEEAYSLAALVSDLLPLRGKWEISVLGTDLNPAFLERARRASYREYSFRTNPDQVKLRYFAPGRSGAWTVLPSIRELTSFSRLNLVEDPFPADIDLVLCRNVLMYFSPAHAGRVLRKLHDCLADDGWLVVAPQELSLLSRTPFLPVWLPGAQGFRKSVGERPAIEPAAIPSAPAAEPAVDQGIQPEPFVPERTDERTPRELHDELQEQARASAMEGNLRGAIELVRRAIKEHRTDAASHYFLATLQLELGDVAGAGVALRRVLFLDRDWTPAHLLLGGIALRAGDFRTARRHFRNAVASLAGRDAGAPVTGSEGLTVSAVEQACRAALEGLEDRI